MNNFSFFTNKQFFLRFAIILLALLPLFSISCTGENNYTSLIDPSNTYEEISLTEEQKNIYPSCIIENYYSSSERKIFVVVANEGFKGDLKLLILLEAATILKIQGVDIQETPEYGGKCFSGNYLDQFIGIDLLAIETITGKETPYDEGDIIYVSHATFTSKAVIDGVNAVATLLQSL